MIVFDIVGLQPTVIASRASPPRRIVDARRPSIFDREANDPPVTLNRALRARRARPPEVPALQPRAQRA